MTAVMIFVAHHTQTPAVMWAVAMICDTVLVVAYMLTHQVI